MKKVVKFGGSSLASAEQFKKVGDIIRADETEKICLYRFLHREKEIQMIQK